MTPNNSKIKKGRNVVVEEGAVIGAQPFTFDQKGNIVVPEYGVVIGDDFWIGTNSVVMLGLEGDTTIGNNVKIAQLCNIGHDSVLEDGVMISAGTEIGGHAMIGKATYVGMGATIRNRVKIGSGSIIGMGSNVVCDIPDNVVAYGNPCKPIKKREHPLKHHARMILR